MVFAVETYCPASDGFSAARIEEEVVLTPKRAKIISLYPAEDLPVANRTERGNPDEQTILDPPLHRDEGAATPSPWSGGRGDGS